MCFDAGFDDMGAGMGACFEADRTRVLKLV